MTCDSLIDLKCYILYLSGIFLPFKPEFTIVILDLYCVVDENVLK